MKEMKTETIRFRCTKEIREYIEKEAKRNNLSASSFMINKILSEDSYFDIPTDNTKRISFSMPDQLGTVLNICGDSYELHAPGERLTDTFLDNLIKLRKDISYPAKIQLYDSNEKENSVIIIFCNENQIEIQYKGFLKVYDVSFNEFYEAFIQNVEKYSIYYAAPCNYRAMFYASFDTMVKRMEHYRKDSEKIFEKL